MTNRYMIVLAWFETRGFMPNYGKPMACIWDSNGDYTAVDAANAHARQERESTQNGMIVRCYSTECLEPLAMAKYDLQGRLVPFAECRTHYGIASGQVL